MTKAERYTWLAACKALAADGGPVNSDVLRLCLADIAALEAQLARIPEELLGKQGDELIAWFQSMSVQLAQRDERIRKLHQAISPSHHGDDDAYYIAVVEKMRSRESQIKPMVREVAGAMMLGQATREHVDMLRKLAADRLLAVPDAKEEEGK